jgi:hypothetical protein
MLYEDPEPPFECTATSVSYGAHPPFFICSVPNTAMLKSDYLAILATLILVAFIRIRIRKLSRLPLPPGPRELPLLGNLFDLPTSQEWLTYAKLCKEYSIYGG